MKKREIVIFLGCLVLLFQSCTLESEIIFHKDGSMSMESAVDMSYLMDFARDKDLNKSLDGKNEYRKFFRNYWQSLYDLSKEDTKVQKVDSLEFEALSKKNFFKGIYQEEEPVGFAMKFNRISQEQLRKFSRTSRELGDAGILTSYKDMEWDGRTLVVNMDFINKMLRDSMAEETNAKSQQKETFDVLPVSYNMVFRFENKIKKIKGQHPNFSKIDPYTVKIHFDVTQLLDKNKKPKLRDKIVVIIK